MKKKRIIADRPGIKIAAAANGAALGVRARSKIRIRDEIVKAGLRLFRKYGYDAVSTQEIAEDAGITQRTLFRYFSQKAQILYTGDYDYVTQFEQSLDAAMRKHADPIDAIGEAFQSLAVLHDARRAKVSLIYAIIHESDDLKAVERSYQNHLDSLLAFALDGAATYAVRKNAKAIPTLPSRIMAAIIFASILPMYRAWLTGELKGPLLPYAKAGWAKLLPMLKAARRYADESAVAYARVDGAKRSG
jgi:AcrR family transcriptional regulator